jgi:8-oxo-dGTP diphosphatase
VDVNEFRRESHPHAPGEYVDMAELRKYPDLARQAALLVREAMRAGAPPSLVHRFVELATLTAINGHDTTVPAAEQPVVAAVVTSDLGVLVGHRNDRTPPWTFIAGEQEPGERPEDTAVREVKEETGLEIEVGEVIGERDHPATGRYMIYLAGRPVRGTKVIVGDEAELEEVRWLDLDEVGEAMPDMFGPVRAYLENTIAGDQ